MALRADAGRYECGTLNTIGCFGLRASMEFLLEVGADRMGPMIQALGDRIAEGAERKGYEVLGKRTPATGAGIVSFRKSGVESTAIVTRLGDRKISAAARAGWVRTSPHCYITAEEIDQVVACLP
jgi:selenocysteine lyase/cysteine desulfurase